MNLRFINTTTRLHVEFALERSIRRRLPAISRAMRSHPTQEPQIDLLFVSAEELDRTATTKDEEHWGADTLGNFAPRDPAWHRPLIRVSPEKVLESVHDFTKGNPDTGKIATLYPDFLAYVCLHELAHALMYEFEPVNAHLPSWAWIANGLDSEKDDPRYLGILRQAFHPFPLDRQLTSLPWGRVIEESMAEAYALSGKWTKAQRAILKRFIGSGLPAYKAGLCWQLDHVGIQSTMASWRDLKDFGCYAHKLFFIDEESLAPSPSQKLAQRLLAGESLADPVDFEGDFREYLRGQLPKWEDDLTAGTVSNLERFKDFLQAPFGVREVLSWDESQPGLSTKSAESGAGEAAPA